ncbi:L-fuculose-phosphate aldolase [Caballeronia udeis]|uniref:L-fuculose-phosphate aldolase n=1 Tax=Caballeronia udeis TaxID=1232866 RepID=A0ABW8MY73_9BURK
MKLAPDIRADTFALDKGTLVANAMSEMQAHLMSPDWTDRQKVALTCRILASRGHGSGLAGQISARAATSDLYYTQRLGLGFEEINESNLLVVNADLQVVEGAGIPNPANRFHSWIYRAREDVQCIVHTHPAAICALGMLRRPLKVAQMDSCMLYDDVSFVAEWPGLPVGNDEGEFITNALGTRRALLLSHHGLVVAAGSIEEACVVAVQCERAAQLQLMAEACGEIAPIDGTLAREAHDWILHPTKSAATFFYYARQVLTTISDITHPIATAGSVSQADAPGDDSGVARHGRDSQLGFRR